MLYSDKRAILELYNALNGTDYQNPDDLTVTTLENAVYMAMKNDVSFLLDERMTLYEHQSTWNPNMPLRDLIYIARLMEKYVNKRSLYQSGQIRLPAPHFVVFYNGKEEKPEDATIKLSDAYLQKEEEPELELKVRYLNINQGCNRELMERCRTLREYSEFVSRIRKYAVGETAIGGSGGQGCDGMHKGRNSCGFSARPESGGGENNKLDSLLFSLQFVTFCHKLRIAEPNLRFGSRSST